MIIITEKDGYVTEVTKQAVAGHEDDYLVVDNDDLDDPDDEGDTVIFKDGREGKASLLIGGITGEIDINIPETVRMYWKELGDMI